MNTREYEDRLFNVEGKLRMLVKNCPFCSVITYIDGCRKKPQGLSTTSVENNGDTPLGASNGNIMIKFTTRPGREALARESERKLEAFLKQMTEQKENKGRITSESIEKYIPD